MFTREPFKLNVMRQKQDDAALRLLMSKNNLISGKNKVPMCHIWSEFQFNWTNIIYRDIQKYIYVYTEVLHGASRYKFDRLLSQPGRASTSSATSAQSTQPPSIWSTLHSTSPPVFHPLFIHKPSILTLFTIYVSFLPQLWIILPVPSPPSPYPAPPRHPLS